MFTHQHIFHSVAYIISYVVSHLDTLNSIQNDHNIASDNGICSLSYHKCISNFNTNFNFAILINQLGSLFGTVYNFAEYVAASTLDEQN